MVWKVLLPYLCAYFTEQTVTSRLPIGCYHDYICILYLSLCTYLATLLIVDVLSLESMILSHFTRALARDSWLNFLCAVYFYHSTDNKVKIGTSTVRYNTVRCRSKAGKECTLSIITVVSGFRREASMTRSRRALSRKYTLTVWFINSRISIDSAMLGRLASSTARSVGRRSAVGRQQMQKQQLQRRNMGGGR